MAYWLFKSEPCAWSWDDHAKKAVEHWDGVRNHQANNNMKTMKIGDLGFFYHSVNEKQVVGISRNCARTLPRPHRRKRAFWYGRSEGGKASDHSGNAG